jgi:hypothetical protein
MSTWVGELAAAMLVFGGISTLGALWFLSRSRFRVRGRLADPPRYRRASHAFATAAAITLAGMVLLMGRAAGGPGWLGPAGAGVGLAGFTALAISLLVLLRERFR